MIEVGDAISYPGTGSGTRLNESHVHVVVKIEISSNDVYLVPISSAISNMDSACLINPSEGWEPIKRESFAAYFHAKMSALAGVEGEIRAGNITPLGKVPEGIFQRLMNGIKTSKDVEPRFREAVFPAAPRRILVSDE